MKFYLAESDIHNGEYWILAGPEYTITDIMDSSILVNTDSNIPAIMRIYDNNVYYFIDGAFVSMRGEQLSFKRDSDEFISESHTTVGEIIKTWMIYNV